MKIPSCLIALVSSTFVCAAFAQETATIRWTFDGKGTLTQQQPAWLSDLDETEATGRGVLRIRRGLNTPPNAYFPIPDELADRPIWLYARIAEWSLNGKSNEVIRLGFSSTEGDKPNVVAQLKFERNDADFLVSAESFPASLDGSFTAPQRAGKAVAGGNLEVLLHFDPRARTYSASVKTANSKTWQPLGEGKTSKTRPARFLRLGLSGPFNTNRAEKVDIDEIVISTSNPVAQN